MSRKKTLAIVAAIAAPFLAFGGYTAYITLMIATLAAGGGSCTTTTDLPETLEVRTTANQQLELEKVQLINAQRIIAAGRTVGISQPGMVVALITALQESKLYVYSNTTAYPESADIPHDRDGSDHDSLGVFQQRPQAGWGTVAQTMDVTYSALAFFGGPDGPNQGSPAGLLDIDGWTGMTPGAAAQSVQVSATPTAYDKWVPAAQTILTELEGTVTCSSGTSGASLPLKSQYNMTDDYGPRESPTGGASSWHGGTDLQRYPDPCGDPVFAVLPGEVTMSSSLILGIKNPDGFTINYLHMYKSERLVDVGDKVTAGQQIGVVGNVPPSTGCHLHLEVNVVGNTNPKVALLPEGSGRPGTVNPEEFMRLYGLELCDPATCSRQF